MDNSDLEKLDKAVSLIREVRAKVDCHYCQSHIDMIINLIEDVRDITWFNTLYANDQIALDRLRDIIQSEGMLRILAIGSKIVGVTRKVRLRMGKSSMK